MPLHVAAEVWQGPDPTCTSCVDLPLSLLAADRGCQRTLSVDIRQLGKLSPVALPCTGCSRQLSPLQNGGALGARGPALAHGGH